VSIGHTGRTCARTAVALVCVALAGTACQSAGPTPGGVIPTVSVSLWGEAGLDVGNYVLATADGGTVMAGYMAAGEPGRNFGSLVRLDPSGETMWVRQYGGAGDDRAWSVAETDDHGFLVAGFRDGPAGHGVDAWVFRVDSQGAVIWEKTFGGAGDDRAWEIIRTRDGQFAIAAQTASAGAGQIDAWVITLDETGRVVWERTYGTDGIERVFAIAEDPEGWLYATGTCRQQENGPLDVYTIAVQGSDGELAWTDRLDKGGDDTGHGLTVDGQGTLWVTGYTTSAGAGGQDGFIARYEAGRETAFWTFGGPGDDRIMNLRAGPGGDLFFVGYARSVIEDARFNLWLGQVTAAGSLRQNLLHGSRHDDRGVHLMVRSDGIVAVGSFSSARRPDDMDFAMFRVDFDTP